MTKNRLLIGDTLHDLTPELVAAEFCKLASDDMATFFSTVATLTSEWDGHFCIQLAWVTEDPALTTEARALMREIGDYAYPEPAQ